jgi:beta-lactam-binding protein with PASTA domain/tRNA A-37 threonylcarbamoyl transferase component Bud32
VDTTTPLGGGEGRTLVGRYALRGLIGQGGMADVMLANDEILDRPVAVKILHARYAADDSFLARFRREAQAAASLNHPNIVAVYDFGEDGGRPFIVMEYVAGQSLRELVQSEQVTPQGAVEIVSDAALGLHYAHERGLVHRDVKPANILLSEDGQVKVTDFGIARAVSAESVTQTAAVFGTAAYVAPEQAQGENVDRRTDVYALGCVLYELLTGRQPFAADSAVALAYKHVAESPTPPTQVNPDISPQLEAVVLKALAKRPEDRYQTSRDFSLDLMRAVQGRAVIAPPAGAYATTRLMPPNGGDRTLIAAPVTQRQYIEEEFAEEEPKRQGQGAAPWILGALILAILGVAGYLLTSLTDDPPPPPATATVPDVRNLPIGEAETALRQAGFVPIRGEGQNSDQPADTVINTVPGPNEEAPSGGEVTYTFSLGPAPVAVPDVTNLSAADARAQLEQAGLTVAGEQPEASDDVEVGNVIRTEPAVGQQVAPGTPITLFVSTGPSALTVPNVVGLAENDARDELANFCETPPCLTATTSRQFSDEVAEDIVISQNPPRGTQLAPGDTVALVISDGPEPVQPTPTPTPSASPSPSVTASENDGDSDGN